jgi:carbamoyl-phosphate synthase (ammonia)
MINLNLINVVNEVSTKETIVYGKGNPIKIITIDGGMKYNIIRQLMKRGAELTVIP